MLPSINRTPRGAHPTTSGARLLSAAPVVMFLPQVNFQRRRLLSLERTRAFFEARNKYLLMLQIEQVEAFLKFEPKTITFDLYLELF